MRSQKPFFHEIEYLMEDFRFFVNRPDPSTIAVAIKWIDHDYDPNNLGNVFPSENRGDIFRLWVEKPVIRNLTSEFVIPFPTKEWLTKKPSEITICDHVFEIVDRWNGYTYRMK